MVTPLTIYREGITVAFFVRCSSCKKTQPDHQVPGGHGWVRFRCSPCVIQDLRAGAERVREAEEARKKKETDRLRVARMAARSLVLNRSDLGISQVIG